jgi:hypothetical protein
MIFAEPFDDLPPDSFLAEIGCLADRTIPHLPTAATDTVHTRMHAKSNAPCDLRQYAALCGLLRCLPALRVAAETVTPSQMRSLLGQGTHASAVARILDRCRARVGDAKWFEMRTFASLGSGNSTACNAHLIASPTAKRVCL